MKRKKRGHRYVNKIKTPRRVKLTSSISILFTGILLSLLFAGCGTVINKFTSEGEYEAPQLPKSELATIKIDTDGGWLQRYHLIVFRIDGKLAVSQKIDALKKVSIDDEILVAPGKRDMSLLVIYESFDGDTPDNRQLQSWFSADVEAGRTYLLKGELRSESNFKGKLVDANKDKVVSKPRFLDRLEFSGSL